MSLTPGLISTKGAAKILSVTPRTVVKWIAAGKLKGWCVGAHCKTTAEACEAFAKPSVAGGKDAASRSLQAGGNRSRSTSLRRWGYSDHWSGTTPSELVPELEAG